MPTDSNLLSWIRKGLEAPGKTRRGLARAIAVDPASVTRMLQGLRSLKPEEIEPASRYLGIEPPAGWRLRRERRDLLGIDYIDISPELRRAVVAKSIEMAIEPAEFVDRAIRSAMLMLGAQGAAKSGDAEPIRLDANSTISAAGHESGSGT